MLIACICWLIIGLVFGFFAALIALLEMCRCGLAEFKYYSKDKKWRNYGHDDDND